jgi:hypothetical protein
MGYPIGAKILVDGEDMATVRGHFPEGSSWYAFPHYKVDYRGGDKNVCVALRRVGVTKRLSRVDVGSHETDSGYDADCGFWGE